MAKKRKIISFFKRVTAFLTAVFFLHSQFLYAQVPPGEIAAITQPVPEQKAEENRPSQISEVLPPSSDLTVDFLQDSLSLEAVTETSKKNEILEIKSTAPETVLKPEPSSFEKALDFINQAKGFAAAAVDKITAANLTELARQVWEYGIAIVKGVIMLFTSHDQHRIEVTAGFKKVLDEESDFLLHKQSAGELDPSATDYLGAAERGKDEYIAALNSEEASVVRFNGAGNLEEMTAADTENKINFLRDASYTALGEINSLIAKENTEDRDLLELYRSDPPAEIGPDPSNPDVTPLSNTSENAGPVLSGDARRTTPENGPDYSNVVIDTQSPSSASAVFNLYNTFSWGWAELNYENANVSGAETFNFNSVFPQGMVLGLSSPDMDAVILELLDANGQNSRVILKNITASAQKWKVLGNQFSGIDLTKISKIKIGLEGVRAVGKTLNIEWGNLNYVPKVSSDPSNPSLTALPFLSTGDRPAINARASTLTPGGGTDYSNAETAISSASQGTATVRLYNTFSTGEVFVNYDNVETSAVESINLNSIFSSGIVLEVSSAEIPELYLQIKDADGKTDRVLLTGLAAEGKRFKVPVSLFESVDRTKIVEISFGAEGRYVEKTFQYKWGNFFYSPEISDDPSNPSVTELPLNSLGLKPAFTASASSVTPGGGIDYSNASVNLKSEASGKVAFNLYNTFSKGRAGFNYDNPATAGVTESVDLEDVFPEGIVFGLSNSGTGLSEIFFEVIDADGKRLTVKLKDITDASKKYKISIDHFQGLDLGHIVSFGFYFEGRNTGKNFSVDWGNFAYASEVSGTAYNEAALTALSGQPAVTAENRSTPPAGLEVQVNSSSEFDFVYDLRDSALAEGAAVVSNGSFNQQGVFQGTALSLPSSLVLAARGSEGSHVRVEVTDTSRRTAVFILNLLPIYQNFALNLTGDFVPPGFDRANIASISFAQDVKTGIGLLHDLVKIKLPGLDYDEPQFSEEAQAVKAMLISKGLTYFTQQHGIDPVTHFPYDSIEANGLPVASEDPSKDTRFTQPTLIGFYLQILGEVVSGKIDNGMTRDQALTEINAVLTSLLDIQEDYGWKGLIPWMKLAPQITPRTKDIALGDNANLAQSLAVLSGFLQSASLTPAQAAVADTLKNKVELFLDNQEEGYLSFVEEVSGGFYQVFTRDTLNSQTGHFPAFYIDRVANEFRGAVTFLAVRYPSLPSTVIDALSLRYNTYTDSQGNSIENLAYFDGGAFQAFWPLLRNNETDFIGFRKALHNAFVTYADYSARNAIPGFISASQRPDASVHGYYEGRTGIRDIAEGGFASAADEFIGDVGSIYALASAYDLNPEAVLEWLASIREQIPALEGGQGLFDSARSASEISKRFLGIDIASTILGLSNSGPDAFEVYMRNKNLELSYNLLYDDISRSIAIEEQTDVEARGPVELQDKSFAVFSHISFEGRINSYNGPVATAAGVQFNHGALPGGYGGYYWVFDQNYDARANQLVITYSAVNTPQSIKIELKDENGNLLMAPFTPTLVNSPTDKKIVIQLPNNGDVSAVRQVVLLNDQNATGDSSANFIIHSMDFQHKPSFQSILPDASLTSSDVSTVSGASAPLLFSSNGQGTLDRPSTREVRVNYDFPSGGFAGFTLNFDPSNNGSSFNLQTAGQLVFGLNSTNAQKIKIEFEDNTGNRAFYYATDVDVARGYYKFLASALQGSINASKIKKIHFTVASESFSSEPSSGNFVVELLGIPV